MALEREWRKAHEGHTSELCAEQRAMQRASSRLRYERTGTVEYGGFGRSLTLPVRTGPVRPVRTVPVPYRPVPVRYRVTEP